MDIREAKTNLSLFYFLHDILEGLMIEVEIEKPGLLMYYLQKKDEREAKTIPSPFYILFDIIEELTILLLR